MISKVKLLEETKGGGKGENTDGEWLISVWDKTQQNELTTTEQHTVGRKK
jgi:hypothetical protein